MTKLNAVIVDGNEKYVEMFCHYVRQSEFQSKLNIKAYSDSTVIEGLQEMGKEVDLWLIHPDVLPSIQKLKPLGCIVLLKEGNLYFKDNECSVVHKYQSLKQLLNQALQHYYEETGTEPEGVSEKQQRARIISVYSAAGGSGKTTTALNLTKQLALRGQRVFYLNFEIFDAMWSFFPSAGSSSFARVQYYLKTNRHRLLHQFEKLKSTAPDHQVDYFEPVHHMNELLDLNHDDAQYLLDTMAGMNRYDVIVVDLESSFHPRISGCLAASDAVMWLIQDDLQCLQKTKRALQHYRHLFQLDFEQLFMKLQFILNKYTGHTNIAWDTETEQVRILGSLPYIPQWKSIHEEEQIYGEPAFYEGLMHLYNEMTGGGNRDRSEQVLTFAGNY